jgi:hypothetical protein
MREKIQREEPAAGQPQPKEDPVFLVGDCGLGSELVRLVTQLEDCLAEKPKQVTLQFYGMDDMAPDPALLIYDTLLKKGPETKIITEARSPIIDSGVLVWLAGEVRRIRPTAWLWVSSQRVREARSRPRVPWERTESWLDEGEETGRCRPSRINYQTVLRLIDRHLPVSLLTDQPLTPHVLGEYCLLNG